MKIIHVCKYFYPVISGVTAYVQNLAQEQLQHKHDVAVLTWGSDNIVETIESIRTIRVASGNRRALMQAIKDEAPDIIHTHGIWQHSPIAAFVALQLKIPYFITIHGTWLFLEHTNGFQSAIKRFKYFVIYRHTLWRLLLKFSAGIIVLNKLEQEDVLRFRVSKKKIHRIPNGTNPHFFTPGDKEGIKQQIDVRDKTVILFVGTVQEQKGIFTLLQSIEILAQNRSDFVCIICGTGPDNEKAEIWVSDKNLLPYVFFKGRIDRKTVLKHYQAADIFVLPSTMETFGTVYLEAMSCELPCIGTNESGTPEIIVDGETGYLMERGDYRFLAEKLLKLAGNRLLRVEMGQKGRTRLLKNYTWRHISNEIEDMYFKGIK